MMLVLLVALCACATADVYMHNPRGSNDRLTEASANVNNDERLFDSQNNAKGGYCWGPKMYYYVGSLLSIEWTNQHSCGQDNNDCDIVLQYMCGDDVRDGFTEEVPNPNNSEQRTPDFCEPTNPGAGCSKTRHAERNTDPVPKFIYGMHETYDYYERCYTRERNKGLFTADKGVDNNRGATATRQNTGGNNVRNAPSQQTGANHGYECPEERDYWPYWHPAPWKDIAILTTRMGDCQFWAGQSQNVDPKWECVVGQNFPVNPQNPTQRVPTANREAACVAQQGSWTQFPALGGGVPQCLPASWNRDNHLGNTVTGHTSSYNWTIPNTPSANCVLRLRYNITTKDMKGKRFADLRAGDNGVNSPVQQDPKLFHSLNVEANPTAWRLQLAIDTDQFGRTFQDRSHVFEIRARGSVGEGKRIHNLNVRGKRGNIVQAYPAVEYDFVPSILNAKTGDCIHIQWTGCVDGAYPGGQAGEGRDRTDRSNMVGLAGSGTGANIFLASNDSAANLLFGKATHDALAWIGQTQCLDDLTGRANPDEDVLNCGKLNGVPTPYFDAGVLCVSNAKTWNYISSRNNNFSNRSQKGVITVDTLVQTFGIVLLSISGAAFVAAIVIAVVIKVAPGSALAASATGV